MKHLYKSLALIFILATSNAVAQQIGLQGVLRDQAGRSVASGTYSLTFRLYAAQTGGNALWSETHPSVNVQQGVYSVYLGSETSLDNINFDTQYFIGVSIQGAAELTPRAPLTTVPYARGIIGKSNKFPSSGDVSIAGNLSLTGNTNVSGNLNLGQGGVLNFNDGTFLSSGAVSGIATSGSSNIRINTDGAGDDALNINFGSDGATRFTFTTDMLLMRNAVLSSGGQNANAADSSYTHQQWNRNGRSRFVWSTFGAQSGDATTGTGGHSLILERMNNNGAVTGGAAVFHRDGRVAFGAPRSKATTAALHVEGFGNNTAANSPALEVGLGGNNALQLYSTGTEGNAIIRTTQTNTDIIFETDPANGKNVVIGRTAGGQTHNTPLQVFGAGLAIPVGAHWHFVNGGMAQRGNNPVPSSIFMETYITGAGLQAFSDARIKNVIGVSNAENDLNTINQIEIVDYTHIDYLSKGAGVIKKVIAQQVEKVFPNAVNRITDVIPSVMEVAQKSVFDAKLNRQTITTKSPHTFAKGDIIRLVNKAGTNDHKTVLAVTNDRTFVVETPVDLKEVFVYGKQVNDFRTVDYEALSMLNVSATQALYKRVQELEAKNAALSAEVSKMKELEAKHASLSAEMSELKDLVRGLSQQQGFKSAGQPSHR